MPASGHCYQKNKTPCPGPWVVGSRNVGERCWFTLCYKVVYTQCQSQGGNTTASWTCQSCSDNARVHLDWRRLALQLLNVEFISRSYLGGPSVHMPSIWKMAINHCVDRKWVGESLSTLFADGIAYAEKNVRKVVYVPVRQVGIPNNNPFHCDPRVVNVEARVPELLNLQQLIVNKRGQPKI